MSHLRAAVVGFGWAGDQHARWFAQHPDVELVAMAGHEQRVGRALAEKYGPFRIYPDWRELLAAEELDVISIATPTYLHGPIAIAALDLGIHVLSEKPLAESTAVGEQMVDAAHRNDRVLEVAFNHRYRGDVAAVSTLIRSGRLGEIYYCKAGWTRRRGIPRVGSWFNDRTRSGGGALADIGIHMLDAVLDVLGEPEAETVVASTYAKFGPRGRGYSGYGLAPVGNPGTAAAFDVEDLGTAFLRFDNGATLLLEASWAQAVPDDRTVIEFYGTEGSAVLAWGGTGVARFESLEVVVEIDGLVAKLEPRIGPHGGHEAVVDRFVKIVQNGQWASHRGAQALKRCAILEACYESAATEAAVRPANKSQDLTTSPVA